MVVSQYSDAKQEICCPAGFATSLCQFYLTCDKWQFVLFVAFLSVKYSQLSQLSLCFAADLSAPALTPGQWRLPVLRSMSHALRFSDLRVLSSHSAHRRLLTSGQTAESPHFTPSLSYLYWLLSKFIYVAPHQTSLARSSSLLEAVCLRLH